MISINTFTVDDPSHFNYIVCPENDVNTQNYLREQLNRNCEGFSDVTKKFFQESRNLFERLNNSTAINAAKRALKFAKGLFHPNSIIELDSLEALRGAQAIMQRYIMAEPTIRKLYHEQRCDGFSDTYIDLHPKAIKEDHYDYCRVMQDIVVEEEDSEGNINSYFNHYSDVEYSDEPELEFDDQVRILNTWEVMKLYISNSQDPTDITGGELG